jgi:hypothetical protein
MNLGKMISVYSIAGAFVGVVPAALLSFGYDSAPIPESPVIPLVMIGLFFAGPLLGFLGGAHYDTRRWLSAGEVVGLTPADGSDGSNLVGFPPLTGLVDGRQVRVEHRTRTTSTSSGLTSDNAEESYIYIETPLDPPAHEGVTVSQADSKVEFDDTRTLKAIKRSENAGFVHDQELVAIGADDMYAQAVVTGRARQAIRQADGIEKIKIGDLSDTFEAIGQEVMDQADRSEPFGLSLPNIYEGWGEADPATAIATVDHLFHDGAKLERQVTAVVAAANAYEDARSSRDRFD